MTLISKFHPLLVHFPIALVLAAAVAEFVVIATTRQAWRTVAVANIRAAAAMGVVDGDHGLAIRVVAVGRCSVRRSNGIDGWEWPVRRARSARRSCRRVYTVSSRRSAFVYRFTLFVTALLVAITGSFWVGRSCGEPGSFDRSQRCRIDQRRVSVKNKNDETEWDRRGFLKCMAWVGTGAVWTMTSGILKGMPIEQAARAGAGTGGLRFVQISDSHIGFNKDANPDVTATLRAAIAKIHALPQAPSFVLHTGDLTHLSKPDGVRHAAAGALGDRRAGVLRAGRTRRAERQRQELSRALREEHARAPVGTASTRPACTSSGWSTSSISRRAAWARSAPSSSNGWRRT